MEKEYIKLEVKDVELNFAIRALLKKWKSRYDYEAQAWEVLYLHPDRFDKVLPIGRWEYDGNQVVFRL